MSSILKDTRLMICALAALICGLVIGLVLGAVVFQGKSDTLAATGIDMLPEEVITTLSVEIAGTIQHTDDNSLTIEANGKEVTLDIPEMMTTIPLTETSPATEEDQVVWDAYQEDLRQYNEEMANYVPSADATETDPMDMMPVYPTAPFQLLEGMVAAPESPEAQGLTKVTDLMVPLKELKKGDAVRVMLSFSTPEATAMEQQTESQERALRISSIFVTR